jgi:hypothetical protein
MSPDAPKGPEELRALREHAKVVSTAVVGLKEKVTSADERRCPFLKTELDPEKDDTPMVDGVCDVRAQTFSDLPPFGPKNLEVCALCLQAKTLTVQEDLAEFQMNLTFTPPEEGDESEAPNSPLYR